MAKRMLSNLISRGITHSFESRVVSMPFLGQSMRYSTGISGDSDTHEDFRSTNKLEGSGISVQDVVQKDIKINPVMIYMKGVPDAPRCGFSALAVKVLQQYGVPISSRNILEDPILKEGVKSFRLVLINRHNSYL
ncbi:monothiol glutaredoxin-S15, mitochondrial [Phalaenopsis equestris]|uniref:monothiol glutaredoxin-S15, mitochondrial n=1 Tax=Phalaenopsis equestris TaxID=78828 RepID=UPI0009E62B66|nr:monothiol glutaredoxin-S15, mitochondrial [Phalaenopsis equestris]XP_020570699.1 monothiol glutaredoxin-S15, mitochondrial [Phalaenopsis equestris]